MKVFKFLAVALFASSVFAETIAVLDSKEILTNSQAYQAITKLADTKYKAQKQKMEAERENFNKEMTKLTRDKLTQDKVKYQEIEKELNAKGAKLREEQTAFTQKVMEDQNNQMQALFKKFQEVVDTYAKNNKIDIVLNKFVVISNNNAKSDITSAIAKIFAKATA